MSKKLNVLATRIKNIEINCNIKDCDIAFLLHFQDSNATQIFVCYIRKTPICLSKVFHRQLMASPFMLMTSQRQNFLRYVPFWSSQKTRYSAETRIFHAYGDV